MEEGLGIHLSRSVKDTLNLAKLFTQRLKGGDIIILNGILGAGKTTFVKGIAKALQIKELVKSPSFLIIKEYDGLLNLVHIDMYRLKEDDLQFFDFEEFYQKNSVLLVEWNKSNFLEKIATYRIDIKVEDNENREISICRL